MLKRMVEKQFQILYLTCLWYESLICSLNSKKIRNIHKSQKPSVGVIGIYVTCVRNSCMFHWYGNNSFEDREWNMLENMKQLACNCRSSANNLALHWMALTVSTCSSIGWTLVDLVEIRSGSSVRVAYDTGLKTRYDSFSNGFGLS